MKTLTTCFSALALVAGAGVAHADFVILDDLIVDGSTCVGFDCVNGESFGFDTIRLKEHNLRIKFDDTSTASSYPRNDWQLTANDSANGGASKFSIDDISGNRTPFTVEANARSHSLYVDDGGRIGSRTSTPSTEIHTIDGDTPTLRLQQDGSSGFAPQTWDVAGNETNFFIRDVTNGSQLPFRIRPDAPTNSIFIDVDGDVGMGTSSPGFPLHVVTDSSTNASIVAERTSGATMFASATASYGQFGTTTNHPVRILTNSTAEMTISDTSPYIVMAQGGGTYDGNWVDGSSREYKDHIEGLSVEEAMEALAGLDPVKYYYKTNKEDQHVGFIAEEVPDILATPQRKGISPMDVVAVLTKVIQHQQVQINHQQVQINRLSAKVEGSE